MKMLCTLCLLFGGFLRADDLVVSWKGSGVQGSTPLQAELITPKVTPGVSTLPLDETISWKPVDGPESNGGETVDFSAGLSASVGTSPAVPDILQWESRPGGGRIHLLLRGSESDPPQMRGMIIFPKSHFLDGAADPASSLGFDHQSLLSFTGLLDGLAPEARWAVRDGETWYLSESTLTPQRSYQTAETRELPEPGQQKWAEYQPGEPFEAAPASYADHQFSNITAFGVWFDSYGQRPSIGGTSFTRFALDQFEARAWRK